MNLLLLLLGMRPWSVSSASARMTRICAAVTVLSLEMQLVTVLGIGSIYSLPFVNVVLALATVRFWPPESEAGPVVRWRDAVPLWASMGLALAVGVLNLALPLEAADPYHLQKIADIQQTGTLAHNPAVEPKVNVLGTLYELLLADVSLIPLIGGLMLRLHGVWGVAFAVQAVAAARELLNRGEPHAGTGWPWTIVLLVPALFSQLILIKNDLFVGAIGLVVLAWALSAGRAVRLSEVAWACWLAGIAVATKLTTAPLAVIVGGVSLLRWPVSPKLLGTLILGGLAGLASGGLFLNMAENVRMYGSLMPITDQGNFTRGISDSILYMVRFLVSLFDMGLLTRTWWPGRGGWGGTFGLPFVWALAVLIWASNRRPLARQVLLAAAVYFALFAGVFPDADVAQRLALAPALLAIVAAVWILEREMENRPLRLTLVPVALLSGAQIARSAALYLMR